MIVHWLAFVALRNGEHRCRASCCWPPLLSARRYTHRRKTISPYPPLKLSPPRGMLTSNPPTVSLIVDRVATSTGFMNEITGYFFLFLLHVHIYKHGYIMACCTLLLYWRSENICLKRDGLRQALCWTLYSNFAFDNEKLSKIMRQFKLMYKIA